MSPFFREALKWPLLGGSIKPIMGGFIRAVSDTIKIITSPYLSIPDRSI